MNNFVLHYSDVPITLGFQKFYYFAIVQKFLRLHRYILGLIFVEAAFRTVGKVSPSSSLKIQSPTSARVTHITCNFSLMYVCTQTVCSYAHALACVPTVE